MCLLYLWGHNNVFPYSRLLLILFDAMLPFLARYCHLLIGLWTRTPSWKPHTNMVAFCILCVPVSVTCLSFLHSTQDGFTKSSRTQRTTWATDWPATKRTTRSPTPLPSTLLSHFCLNTRTPPHSQPAAAAPPPRQKTPSPLLHTPRPSLNTHRYRAYLLLPREWRRTLFPKSSTSEPCYKLRTHFEPEPFPKRRLLLNRGLPGSVSALFCTVVDDSGSQRTCSSCFWTRRSVSKKTLSLLRPVFNCVICSLKKRENCWTHTSYVCQWVLVLEWRKVKLTMIWLS